MVIVYPGNSNKQCYGVYDIWTCVKVLACGITVLWDSIVTTEKPLAQT